MSFWRRTNYRGRLVDLRGGTYLAAWLVAAAALGAQGGKRRAAGALAVGLAGLAGFVDDHFGQSHVKGLKGHLLALRHGQITTGVIKLVALPVAGLMAALAESGNPRGSSSAGKTVTALVIDSALVAGWANLINLLDVRPGRALKAAALGAVAAWPGQGGPLAEATLTGIVLEIPAEVTETTMLGDCGAAALGTAVGVAGLRSWPLPVRTAVAALLAFLTLASEKVSFSDVIDQNGPLRRLDQLMVNHARPA
ncbi:MAG: hypothetical protein FWG16_02850 [Micrococcales bacterium]|nr:hypothetical protein [Micrococcales bacterium]